MRPNRQYVRRTPKIYGNLQPRKQARLSPFAAGKIVRKILPFAAVAALLYVLVASPLFKVRHVEVRGASLVEAAELQAEIPTGGSLWLFPKAQVAANLQEHPAIEGIRILRGVPNSILIEVNERPAKALWISGPTAFVLDDSGRAYLSYPVAELPSSETTLGSTLATLPRIVDNSGLQAKVGEQVASTLFLTFVSNVSKLSSELLPVLPLERFEVATTTYEVKMITKSGLVVQLNSLGDAGVQMRNLARLSQEGKLDGARAVDLRVDRWAYVE